MGVGIEVFKETLNMRASGAIVTLFIQRRGGGPCYKLLTVKARRNPDGTGFCVHRSITTSYGMGKPGTLGLDYGCD